MNKIVSVSGVSGLLVTVAWGITLSSPGECESGCDLMACADFLTSHGKPQVAAGAPAGIGEAK